MSQAVFGPLSEPDGRLCLAAGTRHQAADRAAPRSSRHQAQGESKRSSDDVSLRRRDARGTKPQPPPRARPEVSRAQLRRRRQRYPRVKQPTLRRPMADARL